MIKLLKLLHELFGHQHCLACVPELMPNDLVLDNRYDKVAWVFGCYWTGNRKEPVEFVEVVYLNGDGRIHVVRRSNLIKIS